MINKQRRLKLPEMEGAVARWYARNRETASQMAGFRAQAARLAHDLPRGAAVLEVAPGPGHHAIELAKLGLHVTGLDISRTMVEIATGKAREAGVSVDFRLGDASSMPFEAGSFDLVVCQAAFKNFRQPVRALDEMHRALREGGVAVIQDMWGDATGADIAREVSGMQLSGLNALTTRLALTGLRRRAYSVAAFQRLAAESTFRACEVETAGIEIEVRLRKAHAG